MTQRHAAGLAGQPEGRATAPAFDLNIADLFQSPFQQLAGAPLGEERQAVVRQEQKAPFRAHGTQAEEADVLIARQLDTPVEQQFG